VEHSEDGVESVMEVFDPKL